MHNILLLLSVPFCLLQVDAFSPSLTVTLGRKQVISARRPAVLLPTTPQSFSSTMLEAVKDSSEDENDKDEKEHLKGNITEKLSMSFSNEDEKESAGVDASVEITPAKKKGVWENLKQYVSPPDDGSTFRQRLAKLGLAAALSYGWVSNMSYSVSVSLAWYIFSKRTGMSPIAPGQWKGFLTIYAGFFVFNNIIRPVRVAVAVAISPKFDRLIARIQKYLNVSKPVAVTFTVLMANVVGTFAAMGAGITLASIFSGVPIWAK